MKIQFDAQQQYQHTMPWLWWTIRRATEKQ